MLVNQTHIMKKLFIILVLFAIAAVPMQQTQATVNTSKKVLSIGLNVLNNTTDGASFYLYGPTPVSNYLSAGSATSYGPLTAGTYTINVYAAQAGSRTFVFNGQSITTSAGYATFNNVSITYTSFLYIY